MENLKDQEIIKLSDRSHILLRPAIYLGSVDFISKEEYVLENKKLIKKEITYVPGLLKIVNEILDNSVDEGVRTGYKFGNKIKISIDETTISIEDNGRGIPVKKSGNTEHYMPVLAFCEARTGSNFVDDANRSTIGMNGVGAAITNIYSTYFKADTSDGKNRLTLVCKDNMKTDDYHIQPCTNQYTKITFKPDLKRFKLSKIDENHIALIKQRVLFLSMSHPEIKFYFNSERIFVNNEKNFMNMFSDNFEILSGKNWFVGVFPNEEDDFNFFTYVNGLYIKNGGNHLSLISYEIVSRIKEKLEKRYKTIKPGDVRNKISLVIFFKDFKNMKFDSQTKETLTNSTAEIREYMGITTDDWNVFGKKILRNTFLIDPIIEMFKIKEEFKKKQELKKVSGPKKRVVSDKYFPSIGSKKYLLLAEGDSAVSGIMPVLGRKDFGYFALRGKPLNTYDVKTIKLIANQEIQNIIDILGLDLTDTDTDMEYEKVVFASDQDSDGNHIRSLLLTFFNRFTPKMIKDGRICFMNTPLVIAKKKNEIKHWFFDFDSYKAFKTDEKLDWKYFKGLGSWTKTDLQGIIERAGGFINFLVEYEMTKNSDNELKTWMKNSEADERKKKLYGKAFNISTV